MAALGTLVEDSGALIRTTQLHGIEIQLVVAALGAGLLDSRVLGGFGVFGVVVNPSRLLGGRAAGDYFSNYLAHEPRLEGTGGALDRVGGGRLEDGAAVRAEGPALLLK